MKRNTWTILLLTVSVVCIGVGLLDGQQTTVLSKAIRICLECVGIG